MLACVLLVGLAPDVGNQLAVALAAGGTHRLSRTGGRAAGVVLLGATRLANSTLLPMLACVLLVGLAPGVGNQLAVALSADGTHRLSRTGGRAAGVVLLGVGGVTLFALVPVAVRVVEIVPGEVVGDRLYLAVAALPGVQVGDCSRSARVGEILIAVRASPVFLHAKGGAGGGYAGGGGQRYMVVGGQLAVALTADSTYGLSRTGGCAAGVILADDHAAVLIRIFIARIGEVEFPLAALDCVGTYFCSYFRRILDYVQYLARIGRGNYL